MLNGYELKFPSKDIANALYSQPNYKELKGQKSLKIDETFIIKGDNLDALKILAKGYTNKIKILLMLSKKLAASRYFLSARLRAMTKVFFISNSRRNSR